MPARTSRRQAAASQEDADMEDAPAVQSPVAKIEDSGTAEAAADEPVMKDESMAEDGEDAPEGEGEAEEEEEEEEEPQRVRLLPGSTPTAASFEFLEEGHTLGNALRFIIMKNPNVEFCAYAIPHPSEAKMNIRIQTYEGTAIEALEKGLRDLQDLCDVVGDKYWESRNEFANTMQA